MVRSFAISPPYSWFSLYFSSDKDDVPLSEPPPHIQPVEPDHEQYEDAPLAFSPLNNSLIAYAHDFDMSLAGILAAQAAAQGNELDAESEEEEEEEQEQEMEEEEEEREEKNEREEEEEEERHEIEERAGINEALAQEAESRHDSEQQEQTKEEQEAVMSPLRQHQQVDDEDDDLNAVVERVLRDSDEEHAQGDYRHAVQEPQEHQEPAPILFESVSRPCCVLLIICADLDLY